MVEKLQGSEGDGSFWSRTCGLARYCPEFRAAPGTSGQGFGGFLTLLLFFKALSSVSQFATLGLLTYNLS